MKKIIVGLLLTVVLTFGFIYSNREYAVEDSVNNRVIYNFEDVVTNPDSYGDYNIIIYNSYREYIDAIIEDENVNFDAKNNLYMPPYNDEDNIVYAKYTDTITVTNKYNIHPYYYIKFKTENDEAVAIDSITAAAINFSDDAINRSFSGTLLYHHESDIGIFQIIYGNFYPSCRMKIKQSESDSLIKIEYMLAGNNYSDKSVSFDKQRNIYFQFK
ncbi:MAG: hypothetical protein IKY30_09170 [Oscillospiraceae bacterium]|nr:hypothetical protein [Oscillospiraceae bacterium]